MTLAAAVWFKAKPECNILLAMTYYYPVVFSNIGPGRTIRRVVRTGVTARR